MAEQGPHYSSQTKARKAALDILFMAEQREASVSETFAEQRTLAGTTVRPLTTDIVLGVAEHQQEIDQRIAESTSMNWPLERMPSVDRNLARLTRKDQSHRVRPLRVRGLGTAVLQVAFEGLYLVGQLLLTRL